MTIDRTFALVRPTTADRPAARAASLPREHAPQPQENPAAEVPSRVPFVLTVAAPQGVATPVAVTVAPPAGGAPSDPTAIPAPTPTPTRRGAVAASARVVAPAVPAPAPAFPIAPPASVVPGARAASARARP